jgi:hypothetical protein
MRDRCLAGFCDLHVMLRRVRVGPDSADNLAIDDNWKRALCFSEALRRNGSSATVIDCVFERLTWLLQQGSRSGFIGRKFRAG